ncbi:TPA: PLP-dependent transferase [Staphylococcus aureus]|nr:PLP-dependent transferase [Staphylococcus aureus]
MKDTQLAQITLTDDSTGAIANPIHLSTAYKHPKLGQSTGFDYTRTKNPTRSTFETCFAKLEHGIASFATSSGMSAIQLICNLFKPHDEILVSFDLYGGTFRLFEFYEQQYDIKFKYVDFTDYEQVEKEITDKTVALFIEPISNPQMIAIDVKPYYQLCKAKGLLSIIDNTFLTPYLSTPLAEGADIVLHSATKYIGGHSDLIAGAVITNNEAISEALYLIQNGTGNMLSAQDSWTLAKHLKTFPIRFKQSVENAQKIVSFLIKQDEISEVYYPGLTTAHLEQAKNGGAVIGFRLADESKAQQFVDALTLPLVSVSLGGVETILSHPATMSHAALPEEVRQERGITFGLFRLSVGLEDPDELIADIKYALKEAFNESIPHTIER